MARPRIFLSSTFYELRNVRAELDSFIASLGYDVVRHERGDIAYEKESSLEENCYREIESCDILLNIVGGRFGSSSAVSNEYSISQMELKTAVKQNKQIYVFVEKAIEIESRFYQQNKGNKDVKYSSVDNPRVFDFLHEIRDLGRNNVLVSFEYVGDITGFLREQWAGLFQRLLREQGRRQEAALVSDMNSGLSTLRELITAVQASNQADKSAINDILLSNHPIFEKLKTATETPYRVFFKNLNELSDWLKARGYKPEDEKDVFDHSCLEWMKTVKQQNPKKTIGKLLSVKKTLFDEKGTLKKILPSDWDPTDVEASDLDLTPKDDDIPF